MILLFGMFKDGFVIQIVAILNFSFILVTPSLSNDFEIVRFRCKATLGGQKKPNQTWASSPLTEGIRFKFSDSSAEDWTEIEDIDFTRYQGGEKVDIIISQALLDRHAHRAEFLAPKQELIALHYLSPPLRAIYDEVLTKTYSGNWWESHEVGAWGFRLRDRSFIWGVHSSDLSGQISLQDLMKSFTSLLAEVDIRDIIGVYHLHSHPETGTENGFDSFSLGDIKAQDSIPPYLRSFGLDVPFEALLVSASLQKRGFLLRRAIEPIDLGRILFDLNNSLP